MASTAAQRGWGSPGTPGTASAEAYRKAHIVTIDVGGIRLAVRREVAPLFAGFIAEITKQGYDLTRVADDWGYVCRYIRGYEAQKILSNHAWGLAIDLNAVDHPLGRRNTGVPDWVVETARDFGLSWGGDYVNRPDEMHFEFLGTPKDAADRIVAMHPPIAPEDDLMRFPDHGYLPVTIEANGKGRTEIPVPFDKTTSVSLKANDDGSLPKASLAFMANPYDLSKTVVLAEGHPGTVGVVLGVVK